MLCIVFAMGIHFGLRLAVPQDVERSSVMRSMFPHTPSPSDQQGRHVPRGMDTKLGQREHVDATLQQHAEGEIYPVQYTADHNFPAPQKHTAPLSSAQGRRDQDVANMESTLMFTKRKTKVESAMETLDQARRTELERHATAPGTFSRYLASGSRLPIVMLACNRPEALRNAISSLIYGAGVSTADMAVVQDGSDEAVAAVVREFAGLKLQRNGLPSIKDGAKRIATNYKYALGWALEDRFAHAPGVIVVEDDLLFSPDFATYFEAVSPLLDQDPSVFVISAWNDNGFFEKADPRLLLRTSYFPGLGWLLPRKLWMEELKDNWPKTHWDHWLRDFKRHRGRDCVFPMVPRTFHAGAKGTFMDNWHHNRYFAPIKHNLDASVHVGLDNVVAVVESVYEADLKLKFLTAVHVGSFQDLDSKVSFHPTVPIVFWYAWEQTGGSEYATPNFVCVSEKFRLWHEHRRAARHSVHYALYDGFLVLLVNAAESKYAIFKPDRLKPLAESDCPHTAWRDLGRGVDA